ncbi:MAG: glutamate--tRNA ligase [Bacteroidales bacterium]|nr:glutamate--tRNA ligase [Bacteroidales bacterium]
MAERRVRVRFAPSPTGPLHMGGVRTALFNYLFAKKNGGDFLLRIEDTDQTRFVKNAEAYIVESLKWCGITPDEGIGVTPEGPYGPYRQSDRKPMYKQYAYQLIESGNAYFAFDTPEELTKLREKGEQEKNPFVYNYKTRMELCNSLSLSKEEVEKRLNSGENFVIRFKMPENQDIYLYDEIRKDVHFNTNELDDKVLYKSDGMPTYHLANVVDDYLMKISHVIRGEEWLSSMPLHVLLYRALGWEDVMPKFAHLPLILKPVGHGKLSKRDGDKLGFPVFPLFWVGDEGETASGYRETGYVPEAFVNMLALLGWNPGTEQEIFTMDELIKEFSLERVGKSGSKFDPEKTKWFNQQWLRRKSATELADLFAPILAEKNVSASAEYVAKVCDMIKERIVFVQDLWSQGYYFFVAPESYDEKVIKKRWKADAPAQIQELLDFLKKETDYTSATLEAKSMALIQEKQWNVGQVCNCLRLAVVGAGMGAHLFDIFEMIGKDETIARVQKALDTIKVAE